MNTPVVVDTVRTPRGKAKPGGGLNALSPVEMVEALLRALRTRQDLDTSQVDEVILGVATQTKEQGANLAKTAALLAEYAPSVAGTTVNTFCASGLEAVNLAAAKITARQADLIVAGGVESVSRVPMFSDEGPLYADRAVAKRAKAVHMGISADLIASLEGFTREQTDAYAVESHRRAAAAWAEGRFDRSLVVPEGATTARDECVRPLDPDRVARMSPAFEEMGNQGLDHVALAAYPKAETIRHVHTVASSPAVADGAGLVLLASRERAEELGLTPRAAVRGAASTSVDPVIMLTAGQQALQMAAKRAFTRPTELDQVEFVEAFSATCLKLARDLEIDPAKLNPNGGTISMGHAFGASGAILVATLLDELERTGGDRGAVAVSGAAGLGCATVFERV